MKIFSPRLLGSLVCLLLGAMANAQPVINSLSATTANPGASLTISGANFNTTPANNIVYFGGARATVTAASTTSLTVTTPNGATYAPVSVLNTGASLAGYSRYPFFPKYDNSLYYSGMVNVDPKIDFTTISDPVDVVFGDLDGDSRADAVVACKPTGGIGYISVFTNTSTSGVINSSSFATRIDSLVGSNPTKVVLADMDLDGKLDIVFINSSKNVFIFRNTSTSGSLSFARRLDITSLTGITNTGLACTDIDGDGKPEIILATNGITTKVVSILRNTSSPGALTTGSFASPVTFVVGSENLDKLTVADFNNDGKQDVAVIVAGTGRICLYENTSTSGTISLGTRVDFTGSGSSTFFITSADIDGDGWLDLITSGTVGDFVSVYRNTGAGGAITTSLLATRLDFSTNLSPRGIAIGDVDGDGKPDMLVANSGSANVSLFRNTATSGVINSGSFAAGITIAAGSTPIGAAMADVDGDTKPEIIITNQAANTLSVYRNNPLITPPAVSAVSPAVANPGATVTITGSNFNTTPANNIVYFGATKASVTAASTTSLTVAAPSGATFAPISVNNTATNVAGWSQYPFLPKYDNSAYIAGLVNFDAKVDFAAGTEPTVVGTADFDGDGKTDIATVNYASNRLSIYRNTSASGALTSSSFAASIDFTTGTGPTNLAIGDLDGDGKPDIVVGNYNSSGSVSVFRNTSTPGSITTGSFATKVDFSSGAYPSSVAIADIDMDGKPEIVVANGETQKLAILRNLCSPGILNIGSFAARVDFATATGTSSAFGIDVGDVDGDNKPDIVIGNYLNGNFATVFRNTSSVGSINSSSLASGINFATGLVPISVRLADIDLDGRQDLLITNNTAQTISILRNTATSGVINSGSFASAVDFATGAGPRNIEIADVNGDGKGDVVIANRTDNTVSFYLNTSSTGVINSSTLAARKNFATATAPNSVAAGDFDGDGKADICIANNVTSGSISVMQNNPLVPITGTTSLCALTTTTLTNTTTGGTWSSSNTAVATVGSTTGVVTGVTAGTTIISYNVIGGRATQVITVEAAPNAITGSRLVSVGSTTNLLVNVPGGIWSSSSPGVATVGTSGVVNGVSIGTSTVSYLLTNSCGTVAVSAIINVTNDTLASRVWSTYYGGGTSDEALGVATDAAGNVYVTGYSNSVSAIATAGAYQTTSGGGLDAFLVKFNSLGVRQWATYYGGSGDEYGNALSIDTIGNIYVVGHTSSTSGIATGGAHQTIYGGGTFDAFIVKFNSSGVRQWATLYGGNSNDRGYAVSTDRYGNVFVTGETGSTSGIATGGAHQPSSGGNGEGFLVKFNDAGVRQWATYYGGADGDEVHGMATDISGNVFITGYTASSTGISTAGAYQATYGGGASYDAFLAKFNSAGIRQWCTYFGGTAFDYGFGVATDRSGNVYLAGQTATTSGIATSGAHQTALAGGNDGFIARFNNSGTLQWSSYYGGTGDDRLKSVSVDIAGNLYITGYTGSTSGIATIGGFQTSYGGGSYDAFTFKLNSGGVRQWATYSGGSADDYGQSVAVDTIGRIYLAGTTSSTSGISVIGSHQATYGGGTNDAFIVAFGNAAPISGVLSLCSGSTTTLSNATTGGTWSSGNTAVATVGSTTGVVTGVAASTAIISYSVAGGRATVTVTVNPTPSAITGTTSVCMGGTTTLSNITAGGVWSSSNTGVAAIGSTGVVSGVAAGTAVISYTLSGGCSSALTISVNPTPTITLGIMPNICAGDTTALLTYTGLTGSPDFKITWDDTAVANGFVGSRSMISTIAGNQSIGGTYSGNGGSATAAGLFLPSGVAKDAYGNLYIADWYNSVIRKVTPAGIISTFAGIYSYMSGGYTGDGGPATAAELYRPRAVALDAFGNLFISDASNNVIRKVNPAGIITTIAGTPAGGYSGDGGAATNAQLDMPNGIAVDGAGNLYIADEGNNVVRKVTPSGLITTVAGDYSIGGGYSGDGGPATNAALGGPFGVAITSAGELFITDGWNHVIRKVDVSGYISTYAGNSSLGAGYSGDGGPATAARLWEPCAIAADASGNIYFTNFRNNVVRKVSTSRIITTVAGQNSTSGGYSGDGGLATAAIFNQPLGITVDAFGNLLVSDTWNHVIRKVSNIALLSGSPITQKVPSTAPPRIYRGELALYIGECSINQPISISINPLPTAGAITSASTVCIGRSIGLTNSITGGTWSSSSGNVSVSGSSVTGVTAGTAVISYTVSNSCGTAVATTTIAVNPLPNAGTITGGSAVCVGSTIGLSNSITGGTWSSASSNVSVSGSTVTGVSAGTAVISYMVTNSCGSAVATTTITVNPLPNAGTITGASTVCVGSSIGLSNTTTGGTWSSANSNVNISGSTLTGVSAGNGIVTYTVVNACGTAVATATILVNPIVSGGLIYTIAGTGSVGSSGDGGDATSATFNQPWGVTVDKLGNIYINDNINNRVRKITTAGIITTVAGNGLTGYLGDGGLATNARLNSPIDVAVDVNGNLYIAEASNFTIRKVTPSGVISTVAGTGSSGFTGDGGAATLARLNQLSGVAVDPAGNIYIADDLNNRIRKVSASGIITTIAGTGSSGYNGDGIAATAATIWRPGGVTVDGSGNVYIADQVNHRIRKVNGSGIISTIAGTGTSGFSGDGSAATTANISSPSSVEVDNLGNVYFVSNSNRVRMISSTGIISTVAGTGVSGYNGDGIIATSAQLNNPEDIAVDSVGNLFVTDILNRRVRKISGSANIIFGANNICQGTGTNFSAALADGIWSSSNTAVATIGSNGSATGVSTGTAIITYTVNAPCFTSIATKVLTISVAPSSILGSNNICEGSSTMLGNAIAGGSWISSNTTVAVIGTTGIATGISAGTAVITYSNLCGQTTTTMTVNPLPNSGTITSAGSVCVGSTIGLTNTTTGGTWSSASGTVSISGSTLTGVTAGSAIITYAVTNGCGTSSTNATVIINPLPNAGMITGASSVCVGSTIGLTSTSTGGTWSSASGAVTVAGSVITGVSAGSAVITYSVTNGCGTAFATTTIVVNPLPNAGSITGARSVCVGANILLTDGVSGGIWSSGNTAVAIVGSAGIVTAISAGTTTISYTVTNSCGAATATALILVSPLPTTTAITGPNTVASGSAIWLTNATIGGTWSSSAPGVATVASTSGVVTGISIGTTSITYTVTTACGFAQATKVVTVTATAATPIITTFAGTGTSGSSGDGGMATAALLNGPNDVTADVAGNVYILDVLGRVVRKVDIAGTITTVAGNGSIGFSGDGGPATAAALNGPIRLAADVSGNIYISEINRIRKVNTSGIISTFAGNGISGYTGDGGAATAAQLSNPIGMAIDLTGNLYFADNNNAVVRKITPAGIISAVAGNGAMGFSGNGGPATAAQLSGPYDVTADLYGNLYIADIGNLRIRKVDPSGIITTFAGAGGTAGYGGDGGAATAAVFYLPSSVTTDFAGNVYIGDDGNSRVRKVDISTGIINTYAGNGSYGYSGDGGPANAAEISSPQGMEFDGSGNFYLSDYQNHVVRKIGSPALVITGATVVCQAATTTLTANVSGGIWTSGNTGVATIGSATGLVTGISGGTASITYTLFGASATVTVTVHPLPIVASITGASNVCVGSSIGLSNATPGGIWSSASSGVSVSGSVVTGVAASVAIVNYTVTNSCGSTMVSTSITVNPLPDAGAISSASSLCVGGTIGLSNSTTGGTWSSSSGNVSVSGSTVTGVTAGSAVISYTVSNSCGSAVATTTITVNPLPNAGTITSATSVCASASVGLTNSITGGTWSSASSNVTIAGSTLTGVTAGNAVITYTVINGCGSAIATATITVNPLPNAGTITSATSVCASSSVGLTSTTTGGTWSNSSSNVTIAGTTLTGVTAGNAVITYTVSNGCGLATATTTITVNALPAVYTVTGGGSYCAGGTGLSIGLNNSTSGITYQLIRSGSLVGTLSGTGAALDFGAYTAVGTYTVIGFNSGTSCQSTMSGSASVSTLSLPNAGTISGASTVGFGSSITLTASVGGGVWSSTGANATVSAGGVVTGVSAGVEVISYTVTNTCGSATATKNITVNTTISGITGTLTACPGGTTTLSSTPTGGTWTSSNTGVAIIGFTSGIVTGISGGTTIITYSVGGSFTTALVSIVPPPAISGGTSVCNGQTITLSNATSGGTWVSGNSTIASIGLTTGIVTGVSGGTTNITYFVGAGCSVTTPMVVNLLSPITGAGTVCVGQTTALSDVTGGGTWSSSDVTVATIDISTGVVTGVSAGAATITYTTSAGCIATAGITVNASAAISGFGSVCVGQSTTLSNTVSGGVWSSNNSLIASIGSISGIMTGNASGSVTITYTTGAGCVTTMGVAVNALSPITGSSSVCVGQTTPLSIVTGGGTWSSSDVTVATIDISTGIVTGVSVGIATITYTTSAGCIATAGITVNASAAISGVGSVCVGQSTTLTNTVLGGVWSSNNSLIASIGSTSGIMTGNASGSVTISYTTGAGCVTTMGVAVNALSPITGSSSVCVGQTTALSDVTGGGTWSTSDVTVATIDMSTGIVTGVSAGAATITYTTSAGCVATAGITVNASAAISGVGSVCVGQFTTLSNTVLGGVWSSNNSLIASIGSTSGIMTGNASGSVTISYTTGAGCVTTMGVAVNALSPITGSSSVCVGQTTPLSIVTGGGTWSSSDVTVATIDMSTGIVTGVSASAATITYTTSAGCVATAGITVNASAAISGVGSVCVGQFTTLSNTVLGGVWSSGNSLIASIGSLTGVLTGVAGGTVNISYTTASGCIVRTAISVNALSAITGPSSVCAGATGTLSNATSGGRWISSNTAVATVGSGTGVVTGVATGTAIITYTTSLGCIVTQAISVINIGVVTGPISVCAGQTITLSNSAPGGIWRSNNTALATIGSTTGVLSGIAAGVVTISYSIGTGCNAIYTVTVNASGMRGVPSTICVGSRSIGLADVSLGGIFQSSNTSIVAVGTINGDVIGIAPGTAIISYTLPSGCMSTQSVIALPNGPITGANKVCNGQSVTLNPNVTGGTWVSGNTLMASIGSVSGIVTGGSAGSVVISYTTAQGCRSTFNMTVATISAIGGLSSVCGSQSITLTNATAGGSWTSGNTLVANVGSTGVVVGATAGGTTIITYSLGAGCVTTKAVTVNPFAAINGLPGVCVGSTITMTNAQPGGIWSSSNPASGSIGSATGIVTGRAVGVTTISYTFGGCRATQTVNVSVLGTITGTLKTCVAQNTNLANTGLGGLWSSSNTAIGTVISNTGAVTGVSAGTFIISYAIGTSCVAVATVTVNALDRISGPGSVCVGQTTTLSNTTSGGGTWSSGNNTIATIGSVTGVVSGVTGGSVVMSFTVNGTGCRTTYNMGINALSPITGSTSVCQGSTATLTEVGLGTWSSSNTAVATIGPSTNIATGVAAGTATISFIVNTTGCTATRTFTVYPSNVIAGPNTVCLSTPVTLTNIVPGGIWSSSNPTIARVGSSSGIVTGLISGNTTTITYTTLNGCRTTRTMAVLLCRTANGETEQNDEIELAGSAMFAIIPNPNGGTFILRGAFASGVDESANIEVVDMLGQVVHRTTITAKQGIVNERILLANHLANGMYLLNIQTDNVKKVFHFVLER